MRLGDETYRIIIGSRGNFLDCVDLNEIKELKEFINGVTTNSSSRAKSGRKEKSFKAEE